MDQAEAQFNYVLQQVSDHVIHRDYVIHSSNGNWKVYFFRGYLLGAKKLYLTFTHNYFE